VTTTPGNRTNTNQGEAERWASLIGGGTMVLMGLKQGSLRGVLTALAGGGLIYQGVTKQSTIQQAQEVVGINKPIKVEKTVTINRLPEELYSFGTTLKISPPL
jgi:uncharacterized membrane protein